MKLLRAMFTITCLCMVSLVAKAIPISFTEMVNASGTLAGVGFTNQSVTLTGSADTSNIFLSRPGTYVLNLPSATLQIGGTSGLFTDPVQVFDNERNNAAGFTDTGYFDILYTVSPVFQFFALQGSVTSSGTANIFPGVMFNTSLGSLNLTSTSGISTFTSVSAFPAITPELSTMTLVSSGMFGLLYAVRSRLRSPQ